jgi:hypothetical protein
MPSTPKLKLHRFNFPGTQSDVLAAITAQTQKTLKNLPDELKSRIDKDDTREKIVDLIDAALLEAVPAARLIPTDIRRRLIRKILDLILDEILLP